MRRRLPHQLWQLGDVGGDAPGFLFGQRISCGSASQSLIVIDKRERLPPLILHDEAGADFLEIPRRREAVSAIDWNGFEVQNDQ